MIFQNEETIMAMISWVASIIGAICIFGGGIAFCHYYGNRSFMDDKRREIISAAVAVIGIIVALAGFTGIIFSIK
jgi:hypothetical protein